MEFIRIKCLSPGCPAMACPSTTGYCSYHDLQRTPLGHRPVGDVQLARTQFPPPKFRWQMPQGNA